MHFARPTFLWLRRTAALGRAVVVLAAGLLLVSGCSSAKPPPPDSSKAQKEIKELNEARQKEWGK